MTHYSPYNADVNYENCQNHDSKTVQLFFDL